MLNADQTIHKDENLEQEKIIIRAALADMSSTPYLCQ